MALPHYGEKTVCYYCNTCYKMFVISDGNESCDCGSIDVSRNWSLSSNERKGYIEKRKNYIREQKLNRILND